MTAHDAGDIQEILIVEDTEASLKLLMEMLSRAGHRVRAAASAELALRSIQARAPALILMDVKMPGMDGFELCRHLKKDGRTRDIPVIFCSALDDSQSKLRGFDAGGVDYISKPFHEGEVLARVAIHLDLRRARTTVEEKNRELEHANFAMAAEIIQRKRTEADLLDREAALRLAREEALTLLKEKELLLREVHHRIKNNLNLISNLLYLTSRECREPLVQEAFQDAQNRICVISLIHEKLNEAQQFAAIDFGDYIQSVVADIIEASGKQGVTLQVLGPPLQIRTAAAVPLAMVINELVTNALKYAFPGEREGIITLELKQPGNGEAMVIISDNGIGSDESFESRHSPALGITIVHSLVEQIHGTITQQQHEGTSFTITFNPG
jgi:two-component sensor histidine kinase